MTFPGVDETGGSGSEDRVEQLGDVRQGRDVLEAAIGEGRPVEPLGGCPPAELAVQPVVVVVA